MKCEIWEKVTHEGQISEMTPKSIFSNQEVSLAEELEKFSANQMLAHGKLMTRTFGVTTPVDGEVVLGVCGIVKQWDHFGTAWAILDEKSNKYPVAVTKAMRALVLLARDSLNLKRISFTVRTDYTVGHRFAEMLGFKWEARLKRYLPDGQDVYLYARIFE